MACSCLTGGFAKYSMERFHVAQRHPVWVRSRGHRLFRPGLHGQERQRSVAVGVCLGGSLFGFRRRRTVDGRARWVAPECLAHVGAGRQCG